MHANRHQFIRSAVVICQSIIDDVPTETRGNDGYAALEELLIMLKNEKSPEKLQGLFAVGISIAKLVGEVDGVGLAAISLEGIMLCGLRLLSPKKTK